MAQRKWWRTWPADVIFYDEAHTTLFSRVGKSVLYKTHPKAVHLAMTATPERLGKDQLGEHLDTLVAAPPPGELQAMGFPVPNEILQYAARWRGRFERGEDGARRLRRSGVEKCLRSPRTRQPKSCRSGDG
jgi:superfamily II DNA or RNA helicase